MQLIFLCIVRDVTGVIAGKGHDFEWKVIIGFEINLEVAYSYMGGNANCHLSLNFESLFL